MLLDSLLGHHPAEQLPIVWSALLAQSSRAKRSDRVLAHLDLADLARHGHGEVVNDANVGGDFKVSDLSSAEFLDVIKRWS